MYHVSVHSLAQRLLNQIRRRELLNAGDRAGIAVSGGIDSVALLRLLLELRSELGIVLSVVHFNHKLRGDESDGDEKFVADLARNHDLELHCQRGDVAEHARERGVSVETAARELRYEFFRSLIGPAAANDWQGLTPVGQDQPSRGHQKPLFHGVDKVVTGHTLDDQAETVLMRLMRGAGLRGLGGIHPRIAVENEGSELFGEIVRPLLEVRRRELESYLRGIGQSWREDATNDNTKFTRNRVRRLLIPLLEKDFNPSVTENLAELSEIARGEEDYWDNEVAGWMGTGVHWSEPEWAESGPAALVQIALGAAKPTQASNRRVSKDLQLKIDNAEWLVANASLDLRWFLSDPVAVQRRVVKAVGERAGIPLEFKHVDEILRFAEEQSGSGKELSLPLGWKVVRHPGELLFVTPDLREPAPAHDYHYNLPIPGEVSVPELGVTIEVRRVPPDTTAGYNPQHLLDAESLPGPLQVRNWRAGDRFWPAHTKSPKKIKELLQEHRLAQPERRLWPVVASGDEIVWMRGFPSPARFGSKPGCEAILLVEKRGAGDSDV
jgi:tRNA(Ile)-lysidine synthase